MPTRSLPPRPNLVQLKLQASELHQAHRAGARSAAARVAARHPRFTGKSLQAILDTSLTLADAQLVIAREYGFGTWAQLKQRVELGTRIDAIAPHPRFAEALAALDAGDVPRLRSLLAEDRSLAAARTNLAPPYGYFTGATLLHHVAGNPGRDNPLPPNIVEIARTILDAGADVNAETVGPSPSSSPLTGGATTMGLLTTSKQASDMNVTGPLMDLLLERGAAVDVRGDGVLDGSLANHAPRAAEKLIELGARPDLLSAAALGRLDLVRTFFDADGRLLHPPRRNGKVMDERDAIGLAVLYAYVRQQPEVVDFLLEKDGNWNMIGVNNGAVLHRAAFAGDLRTVQRLVAKGADVGNRNNPFNSTPVGWADHNKQVDVVEWLRTHCAIDLHDAASFDFVEHVQARIDDDRASVNRRIDHWDIPQSTPLHWAAAMGHLRSATILLGNGADPNLLAGDGLTALDLADLNGATDVIGLLVHHGGERTASAPQKRSQPQLEPFEKLAMDVQEAHRTGDDTVLQRIQDFFKRPVSLYEIRRAVQLYTGRPPEAEATLDDARHVVARARGFESWTRLAESVTRPGGRARTWARPLYRIDDQHRKVVVQRSIEGAEWEEILGVMQDRGLHGLEAGGQMTDAVLARIAELPQVSRLELNDSRQVTDAGLRSLTRLPHLQHLDLSGTSVTDAGLAALRELPGLRAFILHHPGVSDAGLAHLVDCRRLERVALFPGAGPETLRALVGKARLSYVRAGSAFEEEHLAVVHAYPVFKTWQGGEVKFGLMDFEAGPNSLTLHPSRPYSERGLELFAGLDGLFALNLDNPIARGASLEPLRALPNLGWLGFDADDRAMKEIGALPHLRMLMAQDTVAGDDGFVGLSRSRTIEYVWGRRCYNLTGRGFSALAAMPSLRGLSVSCRNVDDRALSTLPTFPALKELMPMDVPDAGFRHVGQCEQLEALWCMYCRDTTDVATGHIAGLSKLTTYYAGKTLITDRSLEILSRMPSLERITFWETAGVTSAGIALLARLPRLRELTIDGMPQVAPETAALFPPTVRVTISA